MDKNNIIKEYANNDITVVWQSAKCIHSGNCVRTLHKVFNTKVSPWIQLEHATTEEIINTVSHCPSGALSFRYNKAND
ncbi:MAG: (4Fe-4S)-binding protein [Bacteroidota bacterium]|nr:(4Fe-4S)-binding protein [Bacteroidota bacterium]